MRAAPRAWRPSTAAATCALARSQCNLLDLPCADRGRVASRSMASASEAQQLAAVAATLEQCDIASIARLTRASTSAAVCQAGCNAFAERLTEDSCVTSEEMQLVVKALVFSLRENIVRTWASCVLV